MVNHAFASYVQNVLLQDAFFSHLAMGTILFCAHCAHYEVSHKKDP